MKIMLVYPRFGKEVTYRPPLGIAYLGGMLEVKGGFDVSLIDGALYSWASFRKELLESKPDVIGISIPSALVKEANKGISIIKELLPDSKIVAGGPHPTILPGEFTNADFIVIGEGEFTFLELMKNIDRGGDNFETIKGIVYFKKGELILTEPRPFIDDLSYLPWPARNLLDMKRYIRTKPFMPMTYPCTYVISSRGCFGNCLFCQPILRKMVGSKIRTRTPKDVVDEIEYLIKEYNVTSINLGADEPIAKRSWTLEFCDELIKRNIKIKINAPVRIDTVDEGLLIKMKKAGFYHLSFGVESASKKILDIMRKGITPEQIYSVFRMCRKLKILARANLMVGTPGETKETVQDTIDFIKEAEPDFIMMGITTPTPGTDLHCLAKEKGMLTENKVIDSYSADYLNLDTLTKAEVKSLAKKVIRTYVIASLKKIFNPFKHFYFFKSVMLHYMSLLKNPTAFLDSLVKYLWYSKRTTEKGVSG